MLRFLHCLQILEIGKSLILFQIHRNNRQRVYVGFYNFLAHKFALEVVSSGVLLSEIRLVDRRGPFLRGKINVLVRIPKATHRGRLRHEFSDPLDFLRVNFRLTPQVLTDLRVDVPIVSPDSGPVLTNHV